MRFYRHACEYTVPDGHLIRLRDTYSVDEGDVRFCRLEAPRARFTQDTLYLCNDTDNRKNYMETANRHVECTFLHRNERLLTGPNNDVLENRPLDGIHEIGLNMVRTLPTVTDGLRNAKRTFVGRYLKQQN